MYGDRLPAMAGTAKIGVTKVIIYEPYTYIFIAPDGTRYCGYNIRRFCLTHDLDHSCMLRVKSGERDQHKGWRFDEEAYLAGWSRGDFVGRAISQ